MKISILFKQLKSGVSGILQNSGFYEVDYKDITQKRDLIKKSLKIIVRRVPFDRLDELYHNKSNYFNEDGIVILMCRIGDLFEN